MFSNGHKISLMCNVRIYAHKINTNFTKGLKFRQADKENEESSWLIKEHHGDKTFSFKQISKDDTVKAVKNYLRTKHQSQMTYLSQW